MKAIALITEESQKFSLQEVILPETSPDQVRIRTHYSGVSIGTEFALIRGKISWGPYPLCTGYMGSGVIEEVGSAISRFKVGDSVFYRGNESMELAGGGKVSCVSGTHCSHIVTRPDTTHGVDHLIEGVSMDVASMFTLPAVGLNGVNMAAPQVGQIAVVYGVGLIGLGVVAALAHRGCVVIAVDVNDRQLKIAQRLGADYLINVTAGDVDAAVRKITPDGADIVFECTGIGACVNPAIALCKLRGSFVWQGNYGSNVDLQFLAAHVRQLRMFFPCDDGHQPCRRAVIKNMANGALPWGETITHRVDSTDAPAFYDRIQAGEKEIVGAVIRWV